jgi:hypothetical protein
MGNKLNLRVELAILYHSRKSIITFPFLPTFVSGAEEDPSAKLAKVEVLQVRPGIMSNSLGMAFPTRPAYGVPPQMYILYFLLSTRTNLRLRSHSVPYIQVIDLYVWNCHLR